MQRRHRQHNAIHRAIAARDQRAAQHGCGNRLHQIRRSVIDSCGVVARHHDHRSHTAEQTGERVCQHGCALDVDAGKFARLGIAADHVHVQTPRRSMQQNVHQQREEDEQIHWNRNTQERAVTKPVKLGREFRNRITL